MTANTDDLMVRGMCCLMEHLGIFEAEQFISAVLREKFDYIQWRHAYFDAIPPEKLFDDAVTWAKENPGIETRYLTPEDVEEPAK